MLQMLKMICTPSFLSSLPPYSQSNVAGRTVTSFPRCLLVRVVECLNKPSSSTSKFSGDAEPQPCEGKQRHPLWMLLLFWGLQTYTEEEEKNTRINDVVKVLTDGKRVANHWTSHLWTRRDKHPRWITEQFGHLQPLHHLRPPWSLQIK